MRGIGELYNLRRASESQCFTEHRETPRYEGIAKPQLHLCEGTFLKITEYLSRLFRTQAQNHICTETSELEKGFPLPACFLAILVAVPLLLLQLKVFFLLGDFFPPSFFSDLDIFGWEKERAGVQPHCW